MGITRNAVLYAVVSLVIAFAASQVAIDFGLKNAKIPNIYAPGGNENLPDGRMVKVLKENRDAVINGFIMITKSSARPINRFNLAFTDGQSADSASFKGQVTMLYLWGFHSREAMEGLPRIEAAARKYAARGLKVYGLALKTGKAEYDGFFSRVPPAFPSALTGETSPVPVSFVPTTVLVDKEGLVRAYCNRPLDEATLDQAIERLLGEAPAAAPPAQPL